MIQSVKQKIGSLTRLTKWQTSARLREGEGAEREGGGGREGEREGGEEREGEYKGHTATVQHRLKR